MTQPIPSEVVKLRTELEKLGPGPYLMTCAGVSVEVDEKDPFKAALLLLTEEGKRLQYASFDDTPSCVSVRFEQDKLLEWEVIQAVRCDYYDTLVPRNTAVPFLDKFISYECLPAWADESRTHFGVLLYQPVDGCRLYIFDGEDYQEEDIEALFTKSKEWTHDWANSRRPVEPVPTCKVQADDVLMDLGALATHHGFFLYPLRRGKQPPGIVKVLYGR